MPLLMSYFLTTEEVGRVVGVARETMELWFERSIVKRLDGHLVIMNPMMPYCGNTREFHEAVLFESSFGIPAEWTNPYQTIASQKAWLSWRTDLSTREAVFLYPHLLGNDDVRWPGGIIHHGLVVAYSGVQAPWDEAFAYLVAVTLEARVRELMDEKIHPNRAFNFIGVEPPQ